MEYVNVQVQIFQTVFQSTSANFYIPISNIRRSQAPLYLFFRSRGKVGSRCGFALAFPDY